MMYGRGYTGRGFGENAKCFGYGFMNNGWSMLFAIVVLLIIALLIYFIVHNRNKKVSKNSVFEALKMKYVQGEISEEEYLKRKDVLGRK